jgi:FtsZ-binding cell division protein ZapB
MDMEIQQFDLVARNIACKLQQASEEIRALRAERDRLVIEKQVLEQRNSILSQEITVQYEARDFGAEEHVKEVERENEKLRAENAAARQSLEALLKKMQIIDALVKA